METITAATIATLAFQKFIEAGAGELAKQFTQDALKKMDDLRKLVWSKLIHRDPDLRPTAQAIEQSQKITPEQMEEITAHLQIAMKKEPQFAQQVQTIARDIHAGKLQDNSTMTQINRDNARGWQTKVEGGTAYIGEIHQYGTPPKPEQR
jgi:hypothetical protein